MRARHVKVGNFGIPVPVHALRSAFGRPCAEFARVGARVGMELYLPDPNAQTLGQALEWIEGVDNGGLFLDNWHIENMAGITHTDIGALELRNIVCVELSDGVALGPSPSDPEDSIGFPSFRVQAANMRRIPGDGDFDVAGFISAVAATGFNGPWGSEVLSEEYRRLPMQVACRRVFAASSALLDRTLGTT
jgi:sugar phosphate isomerase/epimerase